MARQAETEQRARLGHVGVSALDWGLYCVMAVLVIWALIV